MDFDRLIAAKDLTPKQAAGFSFWAQPLAEALRQDAKGHMRPLIVALAGPPVQAKLSSLIFWQRPWVIRDVPRCT